MRRSTLRAEQERLQRLFERFNRDGGWMVVTWPDGFSAELGLAVECVVTRVAPREVDGRIRSDFWLRWKQANYTEDQHGTHTIKVIKEAVWDGDTLVMVDDREREHRLSPAPPDVWRRWLHWRERHIEDIRAADRLVNPEHDQIAAEWDGQP